MYQFTQDCLTGIGQIDDEHSMLFSLLNEAEALSVEERTPDNVKKVLQKLVDYAATHFEHEEAYMREQNDPELTIQVKEHRMFTSHVEALMKQPLNGQNVSYMLDEVLKFLVRWLYHHILSSDMMIGKMKKCSGLEFSAEYHTDIELIDNEHRRLFEILGQVDSLINNEILHDKYDQIMDLIDELRNYTKIHFSDEEELMQRINYYDYEAQKRAHEAFIDKLNDIDLNKLEEIDDNQQGYLVELMDFLAGWLINHILGMDTRIGEFVKNNPGVNI